MRDGRRGRGCGCARRRTWCARGWRSAWRGDHGRDEWTTTTGGGDMLGDLRQDLGYALRTLRRSPGYAAVVVLTLGLGIGVNTAMFSLVDGVLLAPLPYAQGDRIVHVRQEQPAIDDPDMAFSVHEIEDYRAGNHTLTRRGRVPRHDVHPPGPGRPGAGRHRGGVRPLLRRPGDEADPGAHLHRGGRPPGRRPGDDPLVRVLDEPLRRGPGRHRPGLRDEREGAHGHRRAPAHPAVPGPERRVHADVPVPDALEPGLHRQPAGAHDDGLRRPAPGHGPGRRADTTCPRWRTGSPPTTPTSTSRTRRATTRR